MPRSPSGFRKLRRVLIAATGVLALAGPASADVIIDWNNVLLDTIRATGGPPCPIARAGALMHVAMYDAVNSIERTHEPYLSLLTPPAGTSAVAAAAAASHHILVALYPAREAICDAALAQSLLAVPDGAAENDGVLLGVAVAEALLIARANDGTSPDPIYPIGSNPGDWIPTFPDFTSPPFTPGWGNSLPWTMTSGSQFRPIGPAGYTNMADLLASPEYAAQVAEVQELGALNSTTRTAYETETAFFWANDVNGTFKPPGHLNYITQVVATDQGLSMPENARLFALVNLALGDAGLVAWDAKYLTDIDLWRPISAIRLADTDSNPATVADPTWEPLNPFTPPFPAWVSGHATFGATHASVMAGFFGTNNINFTITSDDTPGVFRTYDTFSEAAIENGRSRIFLGVHFSFDADDAYVAGTSLGNHVVANFLRPVGEYIRGDVNLNGILNIGDPIWTLDELFGGGPATICESAVDVNGDDRRDLSDPVYSLSYLFMAGPAPPAPFPACGSVPSAGLYCPPGSTVCP
ncbi:MAG: vanadium-dependent haloperoxidase [Planctomycetota bacterium]